VDLVAFGLGSEVDRWRLEGEARAELDAGHLVFDEHRRRRRPLDAVESARVEGDGDVALRQVEGDVLALDEVVLRVGLVDSLEVRP